jgi:hypothetical protein
MITRSNFVFPVASRFILCSWQTKPFGSCAAPTLPAPKESKTTNAAPHASFSSLPNNPGTPLYAFPRHILFWRGRWRVWIPLPFSCRAGSSAAQGTLMPGGEAALPRPVRTYRCEGWHLSCSKERR